MECEGCNKAAEFGSLTDDLATESASNYKFLRRSWWKSNELRYISSQTLSLDFMNVFKSKHTKIVGWLFGILTRLEKSLQLVFFTPKALANSFSIFTTWKEDAFAGSLQLLHVPAIHFNRTAFEMKFPCQNIWEICETRNIRLVDMKIEKLS